MNERVEVLELGLERAHAKIAALEVMLLMLLGAEVKRSPNVLSLLKSLAAGDTPDLVPDMPLPSHFSPAQVATAEANFAKHKKAARVATMELANMYAQMFGGTKRT